MLRELGHLAKQAQIVHDNGVVIRETQVKAREISTESRSSPLARGARRLRVVDAGVIVELVTSDLDPDRLGDQEIIAPHLIDSEVTNVLRRLVLHRGLTE